MTENPLLSDFIKPPFKSIKAEHMFAAVETVINKNREAIEKLTKSDKPPTWGRLVGALDEFDNRLSRVWGPISHMNNVVNSDEIRQAYDKCLPLLSDYSTYVSQNKALYEAHRDLAQSDQAKTFNTSQKKVLSDNLRDFHLSGIDLSEEKKVRYGEIRRKLSELSSKYEQNLLDATMAWTKHFETEEGLKGLPTSALNAAKQAAQEKDLKGYLITLEFPSYYAVITYAEDRQLREEIYTAYSTRASDQGPSAGKFDNSAIMVEMLNLKQELARLLDFETYAHYSLETKMAKTPQEVEAFLEDLASRSKSQGEGEFEALKAFAQVEGEVDQLEAWDVAYFSEKLKQKKYSISQEELRPYFPANKVLEGLFRITGHHFGVTFEYRDHVETWHKDAQYLDVVSLEGKPVGGVYIDLYARSNKRGGAWMDDLQGRFRRSDETMQLPVACLVCNFTSPIGDEPALLTHDEVVTLFHEFGHGLHHLLTQIDYLQVSGINGVPWDAVELPSQFFENFCWHEESLELIASHKDDGAPLPKALLDKMLEARNFQSAMAMLRQLEFGLFDMSLHGRKHIESKDEIQTILNQIRDKVSVNTPPAFNRFQHGFSHIFAGGYSAGYYSYKWAEVLSSDAFSLFESEGILNSAVGARFKQCILEKGGSEDPAVLFHKLMGREPQIDALLRHSGIASD